MPIFLAGGGLNGPREPPYQGTGHVLELGQGPTRTVEMQGKHGLHPPQGLHKQIRIPALAVPGPSSGDHPVHDSRVSQDKGIERAHDDGILHIMHAVGDVVGQVHDLAFHRCRIDGRVPLEPGKDLLIIGIDTVLGRPLPLGMLGRIGQGPGILDGGIQGRPGQVDTGTAAIRMKDLGLQPGQESHGLGVSLESPYGGGDGGKRPLPVVPKGRVTQIVRQAGTIDHIGVATQHGADLAPYLGDLQSMGQTGPDEIIGSRHQNLGFGSEAAQGGGMDQPCPITFEGCTGVGFWRLRSPALLIEGRVALITEALPSTDCHLGGPPSEPKQPSIFCEPAETSPAQSPTDVPIVPHPVREPQLQNQMALR